MVSFNSPYKTHSQNIQLHLCFNCEINMVDYDSATKLFTLVKNRVPEVWVKVRCTSGPCIVQSTVTLPRPGAVLNTKRDSFSPVR